MTLMARRASDIRPGTVENPPVKDAADCYTLDWERSLCKLKLETHFFYFKWMRAERWN